MKLGFLRVLSPVVAIYSSTLSFVHADPPRNDALMAASDQMIIDATFDYEVWNQPVQAYEYSYFNPQTLERTSDFRSASVELENFTNDKVRKHRERSIRETGKRIDSVVGIEMKLTYIAETKPTLDKKDSEDRGRRVSAYYLYGIELDEKGNIIGGEWY